MGIRYHGPDPRVGATCDLCMFGKPAWRFPCRPFALETLDGGLGIFGTEGISACGPCKADVEAGESNLPDLETRCIEGFGAYGQRFFAKLKPWLHKLHHAIVANVDAKGVRPWP